jgi:hypothetical protein
MADKIQIRRDSAADWTSVNPVLADGEIGIEQDTKKIKIGDGVTEWNSLSYWFETSSVNWGDIVGTLSDQTDLQNALDGKADTVHTHVEADITNLDKYTQAEVNALIAAINEGWVISATAPSSPTDGLGWYNTSNGLLYIWNNDFAKWLSVDREVFVFNRGGSVENGYLKIGDALGAGVGYPLIRDGTIVGVVASATGGYTDKEFQIMDDGTPVLTFNLSNFEYKNSGLDIDLTVSSKLQTFATDESGGPSSWWDLDYNYRKTLTIDHTKIPGTADLTDFILSVDITDGDLTKALANGYDLVFIAEDDETVLPYERVYWDQSTGELVAHVKISTVSHDLDTPIRLYYGNSSAASDPSDPATVWSDYIAVWHFQEEITGSGDSVADSTENGNEATAVGMDPSDWVDGRFGKAHDFTNAGGDYYDITDATLATDLNGASEVQVLALFNIYSVPHGDDAGFFNRGADSNNPQIMFGLDGGSNPVRINSRLTLTGGYNRHDDVGVSTGWHVTHLRYKNGENKRIYQDGSQIGNHGASGTIVGETGVGARICRRLGSDTRGIEDVILDELRIKKTATTPEHIEAEANNLLSQSTFYSQGLEENVSDVRFTENPIIQIIVAWRG